MITSLPPMPFELVFWVARVFWVVLLSVAPAIIYFLVLLVIAGACLIVSRLPALIRLRSTADPEQSRRTHGLQNPDNA